MASNLTSETVWNFCKQAYAVLLKRSQCSGKNQTHPGVFAAYSHVEKFLQVWAFALGASPTAAFYFLLHLTKGGQGNWFSSLMFLLFCVSAISRPPAGCECVFTWITKWLYNLVLIFYHLGLVFSGGFFSESCLRLVRRGFRQKFCILFFAVGSPEWETFPLQL